jgi:hypothetical protein
VHLPLAFDEKALGLLQGPEVQAHDLVEYNTDGISGWPFIGSVLELASADSTAMIGIFQKWGQKYGPITQVDIMGSKNVIISDPAIAQELFVRRGNRYSNRGATHAVEYISMNQNPGFRPKDGEPV